MPAFLIVRAVVEDEADRTSFDRWYATDHLPWARTVLKADKAWRFWSRLDPSVHHAVYRLPDAETAKARVESDTFTPLIADFDRAWPKVRRTRDIVEEVQVVG